MRRRHRTHTALRGILALGPVVRNAGCALVWSRGTCRGGSPGRCPACFSGRAPAGSLRPRAGPRRSYSPAPRRPWPRSTDSTWSWRTSKSEYPPKRALEIAAAATGRDMSGYRSRRALRLRRRTRIALLSRSARRLPRTRRDASSRARKVCGRTATEGP